MAAAALTAQPRPAARVVSRLFGPDAIRLRLADHYFGRKRACPIDPADYNAVEVDRPRDCLLCEDDLPAPSEVFGKLRWGGQLLMSSGDEAALGRAVAAFEQHDGFVLETGIRSTRLGWPGLRLELVGKPMWYTLVRKVALIEPGQNTDRFTFDVRLVKMPRLSEGYVVMKQAPQFRRVVTRLQSRFPEANQRVLLERADKLAKRVFPVFLTREAAFLQLMNRDLPREYAGRIPRPLGLERAPDGTVKRIYMTWIRLGDESLSHLEFAKQSADLLSVLHDQLNVIHLDLRLDNVVISGGKVCFIDFGSAVRVDEDIDKSPMLKSLFDEMLNTSQIQRTMGRMRDVGRLTSDVIVSAHGRIDKAVDLFYLSLQISKPVSNPDLVPLITFDPTSETARRVKMLTSSILRPSDPNRPHFISARDVYHGLQRLEHQLNDPKGRPA